MHPTPKGGMAENADGRRNSPLCPVLGKICGTGGTYEGDKNRNQGRNL